MGSSTTASGATHAFRRTLALGFTDLGTLGGSNSEALAISFDNTHVAGRAKLATTKYHAFRWTAAYPTGGPMIELGTLGGSESGAHGVNSWGVVVGWSHTPGDTASRAFVYRDGVMSPLAKHVDIEATTDTGGGYNVGWMAASEWLKYTRAFYILHFVRGAVCPPRSHPRDGLVRLRMEDAHDLRHHLLV